jgi:outer membrane protein assembly factor BamE (lipoprotein component of BamABCDE complex)
MLTRAGVVCLLLGALGAGCAPAATTGAFTQVSRVESDLQRGVSTKRDVQRVLGTPKGSGGAVLPTDPRGREVWYYEDVRVANMRREPDGYVHADISQQVLLVFFLDGRFDSFMWFTGGGATGPK